MEVVIKVWGVGGWRAGGRIAGEELGGRAGDRDDD